MRARVSWTLVLAAFLALPPFQRERVDEMGFGQIFRIERMRVDPALTQALRSRWDTEASAFAFPWGHMIPSLEDVSRIIGLRVYGRAVSGYTYPCYHDLAERLLDLPVERRSSLVPRVALQESLGLFEAGKNAGETEDEYLERLARVSRRELASEPGPQADLDLRRFLVLFLGRLLFATRGDAVQCRFLPLLADLGEVGGYAWGAAFLAHQFDGLSASERQTSTSGFYPFLQPSSSPSSIDISSKFRTTASLTNSSTARRAPHLWTKSKRYLRGTPLPFFFLDGDGDSLEATLELERFWRTVQTFIGRETDRCDRASKILRWSWRREQATRAQGAGNSKGGRGAEGPSPKLPRMAMADHQAREKDDDGYWGANVTGIAVESGSTREVTRIAVEIRNWKGVTGIAVGSRSRRGVTEITVGSRSKRGVTGIAVGSRSRRGVTGIAVRDRSTHFFNHIRLNGLGEKTGPNH
ncbi:hypothetical protein Taro_045878 [Colocasia esculenta]|uniref:Aminotransferase-like plant mobile domain-containing protein n=1 Tax=Colocasia esculenta TaxID=4460 RepID=A0A843WXN2_COLES|nr:hypothetical protein [Colocasia esculenta]